MCASEVWEFFRHQRHRPHFLEEGSFRNSNPRVLTFTQDYFILIISESLNHLLYQQRRLSEQFALKWPSLLSRSSRWIRGQNPGPPKSGSLRNNELYNLCYHLHLVSCKEMCAAVTPLSHVLKLWCLIIIRRHNFALIMPRHNFVYPIFWAWLNLENVCSTDPWNIDYVLVFVQEIQGKLPHGRTDIDRRITLM